MVFKRVAFTSKINDKKFLNRVDLLFEKKVKRYIHACIYVCMYDANICKYIYKYL